MIFNITKKQINSHDCFICGIDNKAGLLSSFYETEEGDVISIFETKQIHQSYPERTHGGIICAMLDEIAGRTLWVNEPTNFAVTGNLNVRYNKPVPLDTQLLAVGKMDLNKSRTFTASAKIYDKKGEVLAESSGLYVKQKAEKIAQNTDLTKEIDILIKDKIPLKQIEW